MVNYKALALSVLLSSTTINFSNGFVQPKHAFSSGSNGGVITDRSQTQTESSTQLYIIGPMIKKMREQNAKNKMPMASEEERDGEAPGLRVGTNAWKWPPVWPYRGEEFTPPADIVEPKDNPAAAMNMANMLNGGSVPLPDAEEEEEEEKKLDIFQYWGEEKGEVETELDDEAAAAVAQHYSYYLKDGMEVLELGAAEKSYIPDGVKLGRHVGVGANQALMDKNPSLTESFIADLNDVKEEEGVNSDKLKELGQGKFDAIIMANTIDFLTNPREVFKSAWFLLKPGGKMIVPFANKDAYKSKFERAQTKMWRDLTDDQHMWVCGSFFQFSASDGWTNLRGFDISPENAKKAEGLAGVLQQSQGTPMFVVQADKAVQDEGIDENDPEKSFSSKMWLLPTVEERDKKLLAPRLARAFQSFNTEEEKEAIGNNIEALPTVYESLIKMDQFAFTFSMQAQLATDLISDRAFNGNDEQNKALKMGLGLRKPSEEFWAPVGQLTMSMEPEDKVNLLAHLVPRFGSNDPKQEEALQAFISGLKPTFATLRQKCPDLGDSDIQLLGSELLAAEIAIPGRSTKEQFATWLAAMNKSELLEILEKRKSFKTNAVSEMKKMQVERQAERDRIEALRAKMQEQQQKAREERSMVFNPKTGKMEELVAKK